MSKHFDRISKSKLGISKSHKILMMRSMLRSFIDNKKLITTLARARYFKSFANKIFYSLKEDSVATKREVYKMLNSREYVDKMFKLYQTQDGETNFVNIYKMGYRRGDGATIALISFRKNE